MTIPDEYTQAENMRQTRRVTSAGGVIFRIWRGRPKVALVYIKKWKGWGLPKGHVDPKESLEQTAIREVREETGLSGEIVKKIGVVRYFYFEGKTRIDKRVHHYLMRYVSGSIADHDFEVARVKWMSPQEAIQSMKYKNDRSILRKAKNLLI